MLSPSLVPRKQTDLWSMFHRLNTYPRPIRSLGGHRRGPGCGSPGRGGTITPGVGKITPGA